MFHNTPTTRFHGFENAASHGLAHAMRLLVLSFINGPKRLLTSRISGKCAAVMLALCSPSLLFCAVLTIPALLFQSPQQHAYFYFSRVLEQDPTRWIVLLLAGICTVISLAIPATMPGPAVSYDN
jgi:hypothetical protein